MNNTTKLVILFLVLSNAIALGFLFFDNKTHSQPPKPMEVIVEKLQFDENQQQEFIKLVRVHRKDVKSIHLSIVRLKNEMYQGLKKEIPVVNDSLLTLVANSVKELERIHYKHFMDIKNLCDSSQRTNFNELADILGFLFQPQSPKEQKRREKLK